MLKPMVLGILNFLTPPLNIVLRGTPSPHRQQKSVSSPRTARQMLTDPDSVLGENAKDTKSEKVDA